MVVLIEGVDPLGFTICSKQKAGGTFDVLKSNGDYDIMIEGRKTKADCIKIMEDEATATVFACNIDLSITFPFDHSIYVQKKDTYCYQQFFLRLALRRLQEILKREFEIPYTSGNSVLIGF